MARAKAKERGQISVASLPTKPKPRTDEVPHWKVWRFSLRNPGVTWRRG